MNRQSFPKIFASKEKTHHNHHINNISSSTLASHSNVDDGIAALTEWCNNNSFLLHAKKTEGMIYEQSRSLTQSLTECREVLFSQRSGTAGPQNLY